MNHKGLEPTRFSLFALLFTESEHTIKLVGARDGKNSTYTDAADWTNTVLTNVVRFTRDATPTEEWIIVSEPVNRLRNPSAVQTGTATRGHARIQRKATRKCAT